MQPTFAKQYHFVIETPEDDYIVKRPSEEIPDTEVNSDIDAIMRVPFEHHKLTRVQATAICKRALHVLRTVNPRKGECSKLTKRLSQLPRSLLFNHKEKYFEILAKRHGKLRIRTERKDVSEGIKVHLAAQGKPHVEKIAHLADRGKEMLTQEIKYERLYGQIYTDLQYNGRRIGQRTCYTKKLYDHTLQEFVRNSHKKSTVCEILTICKKVGATLQKMHHDGLVHRDVKPYNILYSHLNEASDEVALADFGFVYAPGTRARITGFNSKCYGTPEYTAPECYTAKKLPNKFMQAAAEDMYALGCTLHEVLFSNPLPWGILYTNYFAKTLSEATKNDGHTAYLMQLKEYEKLKDYALKTSSSQIKILLEILTGLLEPDPKARMPIDKFMDTVSTLEKNIQQCTVLVVTDNAPTFWRFLKPQETALLLTRRLLHNEYENVVQSIKAGQQKLQNHEKAQTMTRKLCSEQIVASDSFLLQTETGDLKRA